MNLDDSANVHSSTNSVEDVDNITLLPDSMNQFTGRIDRCSKLGVLLFAASSLMVASVWLSFIAPVGISSVGFVGLELSPDHQVMSVAASRTGMIDDLQQLFIDLKSGHPLDVSIEEGDDVLAMGRNGILHITRTVRDASPTNNSAPLTLEYRVVDAFANRVVYSTQFESPHWHLDWISAQHVIDKVDDQLRVLDLSMANRGWFETHLPSKDFNRRVRASIVDRVDSSVIATFTPLHYAKTEFESAESVISVSTPHFVQIERYDARTGKRLQQIAPYRWITFAFFTLAFGWLISYCRFRSAKQGGV